MIRRKDYKKAKPEIQMGFKTETENEIREDGWLLVGFLCDLAVYWRNILQGSLKKAVQRKGSDQKINPPRHTYALKVQTGTTINPKAGRPNQPPILSAFACIII